MSQAVDRQNSPTRRNIFNRLRSKSNATITSNNSNGGAPEPQRRFLLKRVNSNESSSSAGTNGSNSSLGTNNSQVTSGKNRFKALHEPERNGTSILEQLINAGQNRLNQYQNQNGATATAANNNNDNPNAMRDVAFEVKPSRNVHPLDQPLISNKGRVIISPNKSKFPTISTTPSSNDGDVHERSLWQIGIDFINVCILFANYCFNLLRSFWNLDLFIDIVGSENNTIKVHIPSVVIAFIGLYLLSMIGFSSRSSRSNPGYLRDYGSSSSGSTIGFLFNIVVILGLLSLLAKKLMGSSDESNNLAENEEMDQKDIKITNLAISETADPLPEDRDKPTAINIPSQRIRRGDIKYETIVNTAKSPTVEKQNIYFTDDEDEDEEDIYNELRQMNQNNRNNTKKSKSRRLHTSTGTGSTFSNNHGKLSYGTSIGYGEFVNRARDLNYE